MVALKSALVGLVAAVLGLVLWVVGKLILLAIRVGLQMASTGGLGAVGVDLSSDGGLVVAGVCFVLGTAWRYRRLRRRTAR